MFFLKAYLSYASVVVSVVFIQPWLRPAGSATWSLPSLCPRNPVAWYWEHLSSIHEFKPRWFITHSPSISIREEFSYLDLCWILYIAFSVTSSHSQPQMTLRLSMTLSVWKECSETMMTPMTSQRYSSEHLLFFFITTYTSCMCVNTTWSVFVTWQLHEGNSGHEGKRHAWNYKTWITHSNAPPFHAGYSAEESSRCARSILHTPKVTTDSNRSTQSHKPWSLLLWT